MIKKEKLLYDMLWYVQNKQEFTAQELADEFQLSVRSIYRYISDLADLGLYIESKKGRNGGFVVLPNQVLPPVLFTEAELFSLYFAIQSLTSYEDFPFKVNTITAKEKLLEVVSKEVRQKLLQLSDHFQISVPKQAVSALYLNQLITACLDHKVLTIGYQSVKKVSQKSVEPIGIYTSNGFWYLFAIDQAIQETRHFRVDRIQQLSISSQTFDASITLKQIEAEYKPKEPVELFAYLTESGEKQCLENRYLHKGVQKNEKGQAELSMLIDKSDIVYTVDFFLLLGKEAHVTAPKDLVKLLKEKVKELGKKYL
ncbi:helix-turn-helix transcriptional regulator [Enterococcus caccae]|uniref:HTH deoR-type domain-containing protein n=1 Tax=Enterococcus caccae ATCC BAA-1240 TaxID=1158612 RepID=R3TXJ4_9ENTE|nr:YafY family protein [Enterococcus caccae]EOL46339.1 hypothetical protein UC7_01306 [Enterococcus caccae ATCC BAA-1240]EOT60708.1 hypothetical protein I580_01608 [Enterococcus caccae ATCC BAA-1240]OJG27483.1 hypothetical protein RU98_GL002572 [Enterococcus caccae]